MLNNQDWNGMRFTHKVALLVGGRKWGGVGVGTKNVYEISIT